MQQGTVRVGEHMLGLHCAESHRTELDRIESCRTVYKPQAALFNPAERPVPSAYCAAPAETCIRHNSSYGLDPGCHSECITLHLSCPSGSITSGDCTWSIHRALHNATAGTFTTRDGLAAQPRLCHRYCTTTRWSCCPTPVVPQMLHH